MVEKDTYRTLAKTVDTVLFKDRNSKFYGHAFPISHVDDVKQHITNLKKEHYGAGHFCYAYQLGVEQITYRTNDDGEPNNSAGPPIYGQIQAFDLTNTLVVVVRYFGGTKLGVSGLINAYKTTASLILEKTQIIERTINVEYVLTFNYPLMSKIMRIIKERKLEIVNQKLEIDCQIQISVRKKDSEATFDIFNAIYGLEIKALKENN